MNISTRLPYLAALVVAFLAGTFAHAPTPTALAAASSPSSGWNLHVDAKKHFGDAHPNEIAHHYCKPVTGGLIECQIYDSDAPSARLVAVETIVQPNVYHSFPASEQALWHWHKTEVPKVDAKLPGMPAAQQKKVLASILPTYGKVWILFDPMSTNNMPTGKPWISILR